MRADFLAFLWLPDVLAARLHAWRERRMEAKSVSAPPAAFSSPVPLRPRPGQWRLLGFALGVFAAAAIHPVSGWVFSRQVQLAANGVSLRGIQALNAYSPLFSEHAVGQKRVEQEAARSAQDVGAQTAHAMLAGTALMPGSRLTGKSMLTLWGALPDDKMTGLGRLREVMRRFPNSPIPCAAYLVCASNRGLDSRQQRAWYQEAIQQGQRLDPDNAFFPFMRIRVDYAGHNLNAALRDLDIAAQKPVWNDYSRPIMQGVWQLDDAFSEIKSSQTRLVALQNTRFDYPGFNESGVRGLLWIAHQKESEGDAAGSVAIRGRMLRLALKIRGEWPGMLLQTQARNTLMEACWRNPANVYSRSRWYTGIVGNYIYYLRQEGYTDEAQWINVQSENLAHWDTLHSNYWSVDANTINEAGRPLLNPVHPVSAARLYWGAGLYAMITLALMCLAAAIAGGINFATRYSSCRPRALSASVLYGAGAGLLLSACTVYGLHLILMAGLTAGWDKLPLLCLIGLPPAVIVLMRETRVTGHVLLLTYTVTCAVVLCLFLPLGSAFLTAERMLDRRALLLGMEPVSLRALLDAAFQMSLWLLTALLIALLSGDGCEPMAARSGRVGRMAGSLCYDAAHAESAAAVLCRNAAGDGAGGSAIESDADAAAGIRAANTYDDVAGRGA